jgi:GxxExxY protein
VEETERRYAHAARTDRIIGVFYSVYNESGHGFLESVYEEATVIALREAGLTVSRQAPIEVRFRGWVVGEFRPAG